MLASRACLHRVCRIADEIDQNLQHLMPVHHKRGEVHVLPPHLDLLHLAQGQALRVQRLQEQLTGPSRPLRYRVADRLHAWLGKVPLLRPVLRRLIEICQRLRHFSGRTP